MREEKVVIKIQDFEVWKRREIIRKDIRQKISVDVSEVRHRGDVFVTKTYNSVSPFKLRRALLSGPVRPQFVRCLQH